MESRDISFLKRMENELNYFRKYNSLSSAAHNGIFLAF